MGKAKFYLGAPGAGTRMKLVANMMMGTIMASLAEGIHLAEKSDLSAEVLLEVLALGAMANPMFKLKVRSTLCSQPPDRGLYGVHAAMRSVVICSDM